MSTIKVDTLDTRTGSGNITVSRPLTGLSGSGASLTALNATELTSGTLPDARLPATLPAKSGVNLTALNATELTSGTVPDARFPATLPAASAANLTSIPAGNLTGTVADARISTLTASKLSGALPAISGASLTNLPGGGKVLQHKVATASNPQTYNNSMTTTTELISTTFTPTASNSTILINMHWKATHQDSSDGYWFGGLYRGSTQIYIFGEAVSGYVDMHVGQYPSFWHMDSPATTSQLTYKMMPYYGVSFTSSNFYITRMRMVLLELAPN
jgi:hypothetical protein